MTVQIQPSKFCMCVCARRRRHWHCAPIGTASGVSMLLQNNNQPTSFQTYIIIRVLLI